MRFRVRFAEQVVGAFVLLALLALAATLILIGANQRWFAKNYTYRSEFLSGNGLSVGMAIKFRGFEIGKIEKIVLNDRNTVDVELSIYDTYYPKVRPGSVLELATNPLGLGGGLVLHPGSDTTSPPPQEGYLIPSLDTDEGKRRREEGLVVIPKSDDLVSSLLGQVDPILTDVNRTIRQANDLIATINDELAGRGQGPLSSLLRQIDPILADVNRTIRQANDLIATANNELAGTGSGPVSRLLGTVSSELAGTGSGPVSRLLGTVNSELAGTGSGPVSQLLGTVNSELDGSGSGPISAALSELASATERINGLIDRINQDIVVGTSEGIGRTLAQVDGVLKTINESAVNLSAMTLALSDPTGMVPKLLGDKDNQILAQIQSALASVDQIVAQLKGFVEFVNGSTPQISGLLQQGQDTLKQGQDVLTAVKNNPLLRGGVPEQREQQTTYQSLRDVDF